MLNSRDHCQAERPKSQREDLKREPENGADNGGTPERSPRPGRRRSSGTARAAGVRAWLCAGRPPRRNPDQRGGKAEHDGCWFGQSARPPPRSSREPGPTEHPARGLSHRAQQAMTHSAHKAVAVADTKPPSPDRTRVAPRPAALDRAHPRYPAPGAAARKYASRLHHPHRRAARQTRRREHHRPRSTRHRRGDLRLTSPISSGCGRSGTRRATPASFVAQKGRLLVETDAASGKVKRIGTRAAGASNSERPGFSYRVADDAASRRAHRPALSWQELGSAGGAYRPCLPVDRRGQALPDGIARGTCNLITASSYGGTCFVRTCSGTPGSAAAAEQPVPPAAATGTAEQS